MSKKWPIPTAKVTLDTLRTKHVQQMSGEGKKWKGKREREARGGARVWGRQGTERHLRRGESRGRRRRRAVDAGRDGGS